MEDTTVNSMETFLQLKEKIASYRTFLSELDNQKTMEEFNQLNEKALNIEQFITTIDKKQNENMMFYHQKFSTLSTQLQHLQMIADELALKITEIVEFIPPKQQPIAERPISNDLSSFKQLQKILEKPPQLEPVNRQEMKEQTNAARNHSFQNTQSSRPPHRGTQNSAQNFNKPSIHKKYAVKLNTTDITQQPAINEPIEQPIIEPPIEQIIQVPIEEAPKPTLPIEPIASKQPEPAAFQTSDAPKKDSLSLLNLFRKK